MVTISPIGKPIGRVQPGEPLQVSQREARILIAIKRAELYVEKPKRKRTYERRDMQAAESAPEPVLRAEEG